MARKKRKIWKILAWILGGFLTLILLITLAFYLGRGPIMKKALVYLNKNRPGEIQLLQMNLIPLMGFPDAVVQLKDVSLYENPVRMDSLYQEPILYIHELYVSLDIQELIRGNIKVEQFRLEDGFLRIEVDSDSLLNLEKALGIKFGNQGEDTGDDDGGDSARTINMERIEMQNILASYHDQSSGDMLNIQINSLESSFSYLPEIIEAGLELNIDINAIKYQTFKVENKNDVRFNSHIKLNPEGKSVEIEPSGLSIAGLELETWGMYEFQGEPGMNMAFRATNTGLDVLNFLFLGVLDMDEIEQIGPGSIHLDGTITGDLGEELPVVRVNGSAQGLGFRIKSIERDVTDISFTMYATNGGEADFSEAQIEIQGLTATYPEGTLRGDIRARNLVIPELDLKLKGELDLAGLEQVIDLENLGGMEGHVQLDCNLGGVIDRSTDKFLDEAGSIVVSMEDVGLVYGMDTVSEMDGSIYMDGNVVGARGLGLTLNGSSADLEVKVENILGYLLDYNKDVNIRMVLDSDSLLPGRITRDSTITALLGKELKGLHFIAEASISNEELDAFIENDTLPEFNFSLDSFGIALPVYADISDMSASLTFDTDTLVLHRLKGTIGNSRFSFSGKAFNLEGFVNRDSGEYVGLEYSLSSPMMSAEDLLNYKSVFLLPEAYRKEHLENFHMAGSALFPVEGLVYDSIDMDVDVDITDLGWKFRYYPMALRQFKVKARKAGDELFIDKLEGNIGESNLKLNALIGNYADSSLENMYGNLELQSDLLDFNLLLDYQLPEESNGTYHEGSQAASPGFDASDEAPLSSSDSSDIVSLVNTDSTEVAEIPRLDQMEFPNFDIRLDINELRFSDNSLYDVEGIFRLSSEKVFHIDKLDIYGKSGGSVALSGELSMSNPLYKFSSQMEMNQFNINDLNFEMKTGEETYSLKENFAGIVTGTGQADVFLTRDLEPDMDSTTLLFQVDVKEGEMINFEPLEAAGKFLDNKNLDHVRYTTSLIRISLADSRITIPLTVVESTVGQILIEGEQGLDNSYLYLARVPPWLVKDAAKSMFSKSEDDGKEDEIRKMKMGKFVVLTIWNNGDDSGVVLKDQREKYR